MELKGSQTEKNLQTAFAGESQARNKYTYFASKAKKEGYEQIAAIFTETADNEKEHAKMWFKYLEGGKVKSTIENLEAAANGENYEGVAAIEKEHEERYRELLAKVKGGKVFIATDVVVWKCRNCGHIHVGKEAPEVCPVCAHERAYFELRAKNY